MNVNLSMSQKNMYNLKVINPNQDWPYLLMLVGLPGSGKSTYIKNHFNQNLKVHSSDSIREELTGTEDDQSVNSKVFDILHKRVKEDLENGVSCIYDATNISWKRRKAFLESLNKIDCFKVCHVIATPYEVCLRQNKARARIVPEAVIKRMYMNFDIPFYNEGWDDIKIVYNDRDYKHAYGTWGQFLFNTASFDQESKWHSETLGMHCSKCLSYVQHKATELNSLNYAETIIAAALHDCGKPFVKTFKDAKGIDTTFAHYYSHEHVGCYDSLFYGKDEGVDTLLIAALIRWHMILHFFKDWKQATINKYEKEFTSHKYLQEMEFYKALKILHEGDKNAH